MTDKSAIQFCTWGAPTDYDYIPFDPIRCMDAASATRFNNYAAATNVADAYSEYGINASANDYPDTHNLCIRSSDFPLAKVQCVEDSRLYEDSNSCLNYNACNNDQGTCLAIPKVSVSDTSCGNLPEFCDYGKQCAYVGFCKSWPLSSSDKHAFRSETCAKQLCQQGYAGGCSADGGGDGCFYEGCVLGDMAAINNGNQGYWHGNYPGPTTDESCFWGDGSGVPYWHGNIHNCTD
jgi:hypothetical protein